MLKKYSEFSLGDILLAYWLDTEGRVSMTLIPAGMAGQTAEKEYTPEPLAQLHAEGDPLPGGYGSGMTLACTRASGALRFLSQERDKSGIVTTLSDDTGRRILHRVHWQRKPAR